MVCQVWVYGMSSKYERYVKQGFKVCNVGVYGI